MRRFLGSPLPKGGDRMERKYTVFLIQDGCKRGTKAGIVRLDGISADEVDFLLSLISRQQESISMTVRPRRAE